MPALGYVQRSSLVIWMRLPLVSFSIAMVEPVTLVGGMVNSTPHDSRWGRSKQVAPAVGFEPTTKRLTAARSTTELRRNACRSLAGGSSGRRG